MGRMKCEACVSGRKQACQQADSSELVKLAIQGGERPIVFVVV